VDATRLLGGDSRLLPVTTCLLLARIQVPTCFAGNAAQSRPSFWRGSTSFSGAGQRPHLQPREARSQGNVRRLCAVKGSAQPTEMRGQGELPGWQGRSPSGSGGRAGTSQQPSPTFFAPAARASPWRGLPYRPSLRAGLPHSADLPWPTPKSPQREHQAPTQPDAVVPDQPHFGGRRSSS
jgi:hypothetical protein